MTIASEQSKVIYNGNGATREFAVPFHFVRAEDLKLTLREAGEAEQNLVPDQDYEVESRVGTAGGSCLLRAAPGAGAALSIWRDPAILQETVYEEGVPLSAKARENALDLLTMIAQANRERISRAVSLPVSSPLEGLRMPDPAPGRYLAWNEQADGLASKELVSGLVGLPLDVAQGGTGAQTPDAALESLGLTALGRALVRSGEAGGARATLGALGRGDLEARVAQVENRLLAEAARRAIGDSVDGREYLGNGWLDTLTDAGDVDAEHSLNWVHDPVGGGTLSPVAAAANKAHAVPMDDPSAWTQEDVKGASTTLIVDTADQAGHFNVAAGGKIRPGCHLRVSGVTLSLVSLSGDGTAPGSVVFSGTLAQGSHAVEAVHGTQVDCEGVGLSLSGEPEQLVDRAAGTLEGSMTGRGGLAAAFNGVVDSLYNVGAGSSGSATTVTVGKDWGEGMERKLTRAVVHPSRDLGFASAAGGAPDTSGSLVLQGSEDGNTWVDLGSEPFAKDCNPRTIVSNSRNAAYRHHRIHFQSETSCYFYCAEVEFYAHSRIWPVGHCYAAISPVLNTSGWQRIVSAAASEQTEGAFAFYAVSFNQGASYKVFVNGLWRVVASSRTLDHGGVEGNWYWRDSADGWFPAADAASALPFAVLADGGGNLMGLAALNGIAAADWPVPGSGLRLAVALYTTSEQHAPSVVSADFHADVAAGNADIVFREFAAVGPDHAKVALMLEALEDATLDTDLRAYVSRGESGWVQAPLAQDSAYDESRVLVVGDADLGAGTGDVTRLRLVTDNGKQMNIHLAGCTFRSGV
ncbi:MAG: hypothetical protein V3573_05690 [Desulfovibrionaceae bacterium]